MPDIQDYVETTKVILGETAKYFALLLFSVLAIRLWRRLPRIATDKRGKNLLLASLASAMACGIGYFSMCHSLSLMYCHFGNRAFEDSNFLPAASLFQRSFTYWENADARGKEGICFLFMDKPTEGMHLLDEAQSLRGGQSSFFEEFYEGLYYFFHDEPDKAAPLLEASSAKPSYQWNVAKLLSIIALEKNRPDDARRLMEPYAKVEVEAGDYSHACVAVSINLLDGKKAEAGSILKQFPSDSLSPFWKPRFEKLRAKIQIQIQ